MDLNLNGKVAVVIASSQGLGKAVATELVKEGAYVMLASRNAAKLELVSKELQAMGPGKASFHATDITKPEEIKELIEDTVRTFGGIDILVNNAGGPPTGKFEDFSDESWQNSFELDLLSYIRIIREALPHLKVNGGRIVNMASISVKTPLPNLILSNTFRTGVVGLSKTLAEEFAPYGILVNVVAPGLISTDRIKYLNQMNADKEGREVKDVEKDALRKIPMGRYGTPEEFGKAVTWLVSGANTYITGSTIYLDGGMAKAL